MKKVVLIMFICMAALSGAAYASTGTDSEYKKVVEKIKEDEEYQKAWDAVKSDNKTNISNFSSIAGSSMKDAYDTIYKTFSYMGLNPVADKTGTTSENFSENVGAESDVRTSLLEYARYIFLIMAAIQLSLSFGIEFISQGLDFQSWVATFIRNIVVIGIFYYILNHGYGFMGSFVSYVVLAVKGATGIEDVTPGSFIKSGLDIAMLIRTYAWLVAKYTSIWSTAFISAILNIVICLLAACVILYNFTLISSWYLIALVEAYFRVTFSMLVLGLGGCRFTWGTILPMCYTLFQTGLKVSGYMVLMAVGQKVILAYVGGIFSYDMLEIGTAAIAVVTVSILFKELCKIVPDSLPALLAGGSGGGSSASFISALNSMIMTSQSVRSSAFAAQKAVSASASLPGRTVAGVSDFGRGFNNLTPFVGRDARQNSGGTDGQSDRIGLKNGGRFSAMGALGALTGAAAVGGAALGSWIHDAGRGKKDTLSGK